MTKAKKKAAAAPKTTFEIVDVEQGSTEWFEARNGLPTASRFADIMSDSDEKKMRTRYMRELAGEILSGIPAESYENAAMRRGRKMEELAAEQYARLRFDVEKVGFVKNAGLLRYATVGASPDRMIGDDGVLEIKSVAPHLLIPILEAGARGLPLEHRAQVQGTLWVTERKWACLKLYWPGMPKCEFNLERDDVYIKEIADATERFCFELRDLVDRLKKMGAGR